MPNSESTTDTESPSKPKAKLRGKKRKRLEIESSSDSEDVLPDNVLEVEHIVTASAVKNNLDDSSVKKILKTVVKNENVLAYVKMKEEEDIEDHCLQPKLTRAKAKELKKVSSTRWDLENLELTPINHILVKTRPEVKALIAQELPEDEDDEEYEPTNDEIPSDDDHDMESCSDVDSQPRTPATPHSQKASPRVVKDGPFKVPQDVTLPVRRKLDLQEEATIALRTRSKLCLSETPIEHIESSFVPPDDVPVPPADDHVWNEFLNDFFNPASVSKNEDDDETDPEYNVAADPDAPDEDEEALESSIIKISKKELSDLVNELFKVMPEATVEAELTDMANTVLSDHTHNESNIKWEGKQEPLSDEEQPKKPRFIFERRSPCFSIGKTEPQEPQNDQVDNISESSQLQKNLKTTASEKKKSHVVEIRVKDKALGAAPPPTQYEQPELLKHTGEQPVQVVLRNDVTILPEQIQILQQQLRQHIQIATSSFLQLFVHPMHWTFAPTYKEYLEALQKMTEENPSSVVNVCNLHSAVELMDTWEETVSKDTPENKEMVQFIQKQSERWRRRASHQNFYAGDFHETFLRVVANSNVFVYPHLLPAMPFRPDMLTRRHAYLHSEDELISLGLEQFWKYVEDNPTLFHKNARAIQQGRGLTAAAELVVKHMMPWSSVRNLMLHIQNVKRRGHTRDNPLLRFLKTRKVTPVKHKILPFNPMITLYEQPEHEVPKLWIRYLAQSSKRFKEYLNSRPKAVEATRGIDVDFVTETGAPLTEPLPIAFTKKVTKLTDNSNQPPHQESQDRFDIHINKNPITQIIPVNMYQFVETSDGSTLIPISIHDSNITAPLTTPLCMTTINNTRNVSTNTVTCNIAPINSIIENTSEKRNKAVQITCDNLQSKDNLMHCRCCILLRKICRVRQTTIKEFFGSKDKRKTRECHCSQIRYPKISNKLKLLIKKYKSCLNTASNTIQKLLENKEDKDEQDKKRLKASDIDETNDAAFVTAFQAKLNLRLTMTTNQLSRKNVYNLLSKFDLDSGNPISLAKELEYMFKAGDMMDLKQDVASFLNPEQAEKIGRYRDYFMQNCLDNFLKKMEEQIGDIQCRRDVAILLNGFLRGPMWAACTMCSELIIAVRAYPTLAAYAFSLFPHCSRNLSLKSPERNKQMPPKTREDKTAIQEEAGGITLPNDLEPAIINCEIDHSSRSLKTPERSKQMAPETTEEDTVIQKEHGDMLGNGVEQAIMNCEEDHSSRSSISPERSKQVPSITAEEDPAVHEEPKDDTPTIQVQEATVLYEADPSSSGDDQERETRDQICTTLDIKLEEIEAEDVIDTDELTISETKVDENYLDSSNMSMVIVSKVESIKEEPVEWRREEDKLILEILQQLSPAERHDKTILEVIDEKNLVRLLADQLIDKSLEDVRDRILYILKMLAVDETS